MHDVSTRDKISYFEFHPKLWMEEIRNLFNKNIKNHVLNLLKTNA